MSIHDDAIHQSFEWMVDYKPWDTSGTPQAYAGYGYQQGFMAGVNFVRSMSLDELCNYLKEQDD